MLLFVDFLSSRLPLNRTFSYAKLCDSSDESLDSFSGQRGELQDISMPSSTEETYKWLVRKRKSSSMLPFNIKISPNSLTPAPSVEEVPRISQTRGKTSGISGYQVARRRFVIKEDDDDNAVIHIRSSGES